MRTWKCLVLILLLSLPLLLVRASLAQYPDSDGDGFGDNVDVCPYDPAPRSANGCPPDSDGDGLNDNIDECPSVFGDRSNYGCPPSGPDSDGDGFVDSSDQCPAVYAPGTANGCPGDADGDGVTDDVDVCPFVSGQGDQFGGVNGADGCPVDSDADQTVDGLDRCPFQAGPPENGGCPLGGDPNISPTPSPTAGSATGGTATTTPTPRPTSEEVTLPATGPCVLATSGANQVNIRATPDTTAEIVGRLSPNQRYEPTGQTTAPDGIWYQVNGGWVAGFVVRTGGDCTTLPVVGGETGGDLAVVLAQANLDLARVLANCPELLAEAQQLPLFIQFDLINGGLADPCAALREVLEKPAAPPLNEPATAAILEACPVSLPWLVGMAQRLYWLNPQVWETLNNLLAPENACELAQGLAQGSIPPDFAAALGATGQLRDSFASQQRLVVASSFLIDTKIAQCLPSIPAQKASLIRAYALQWQVESAELLDECNLISYIRERGLLSPMEGALVNRLRGDCRVDTKTAYDRLVYLYLVPANLPVLLNQSLDLLCVDETGWMRLAQGLSAAEPPGIEPALAKCVNAAAVLRNRQNELFLPQLHALLKDAPTETTDRCLPANLWVLWDSERTFDLLPPPALPCYAAASDSLTLSDGTLINITSPWAHKVAVLARPTEQVCDAMPLPSPDSDGDSLRDEVDACPAAFALTLDGCAGSPPLTPSGAASGNAPAFPKSLEEAALIEIGADRLNSIYIGLVSARTIPPSAVFQASTATSTQIYLLKGEAPQPISLNADENQFFPALNPDGSLLSYIAQAPDGSTSLQLYNIERGESFVLLASTNTLRVGLYPPAWTPDGGRLLVTLLDSTDLPSIYALDLTDPRQNPTPQLLIPDASSPHVSPNGRYIAFERAASEFGGNIFVALADIPSAIQAITEQPAESSCGTPTFGLDSSSLFFACRLGDTQGLFSYTSAGVNRVDNGIANPQNPAPGPDNGFLGFDDGTTIYYGYSDGTQLTPLFQLEGVQTSHLRWTLGTLP